MVVLLPPKEHPRDPAVALPWIFPWFLAHLKLSSLSWLFHWAGLGPPLELCLVIFAVFPFISTAVTLSPRNSKDCFYNSTFLLAKIGIRHRKGKETENPVTHMRSVSVLESQETKELSSSPPFSTRGF